MIKTFATPPHSTNITNAPPPKKKKININAQKMWWPFPTASKRL
jgi:hypothetical protein